MKRSIILIIGILVAAVATYAQESADIKLRVNGIIQGKGILIISVFDSEDQWLKKAIKTVDVDLSKDNSNEFVITGLAPGKYAISVTQDENKNGELDMGMMGPEEGYGFSNGATGFMGPADYKDAEIEVYQGLTTTIDLN